MTRTILLRSLLVAVAILLLPLTNEAGRRTPKLSTVPYDGIDVSHHQGVIDWREVARDKKIKFVYIKATQGATIKDPRYAINNRQARRNGLKCGAYHYLSCHTPIREQFKLFRATVKKADQDLIPMVDVEREGVGQWSGRQLRDSLTLFCQLVKRHYGKKPLIYTHYNYYNAHLAPHFNTYFLFLSKYSKPAPTIVGRGRHNIWQFSERGRVRGIKGYVDLDRFMADTTHRHIKL